MMYCPTRTTSPILTSCSNVAHMIQIVKIYGYTRCEKSLHRSLTLVDKFISGDELLEEVFQMACLLGHVSYDLFYLTAALRNDALLITLDKDLKTLAEKQNVKTN